VKYKISWLDSKKMLFLLFWTNAAEMAVLIVFWQKNGLWTLGVNLGALWNKSL